MARIISELGSAMRPVAKGLIKGGLVAMDAFSEFVAETGEQIKDLFAEARAELAKSDDKPDGKEEIAKNGAGQNNGDKPKTA
jgi:hypothetical protein